MNYKSVLLYVRFVTVALILFCPASTLAQTPAIASRITEAVDESRLTTLRGNTHPLANPRFDRGPAPPSLPMERMLLVLKRSPDQEAALDALLDQQQDNSSPSYHQWLSPDQFGQQFGPSDQDIQAITSWLRSHGFRVARVSRGRTSIEFDGTASQVQEAFHTAIHRYNVNGEDHWANSSDPQIPVALGSVVAGIFTLHNFVKAPQVQVAEESIPAKVQPDRRLQFTSGSGSHSLVPADYYTIYNFNPLQLNTFAKIAIVGRSNINVQDITYFHYWTFDQASQPQVIVNGPDPGDLGGREETEAVLDTTWAGSVAPSAGVFLVVSKSTAATDGVDLSELYIIDNNFWDVMSESFGDCEANYTSAEATGISSLAQQAAAEGITYVVSAGDSGSAGCDDPETQATATNPPSVNVLASTPYTVAVGGTTLNENGNPGNYWNSTDAPSTLGSAKSYIPENVWNESCTLTQSGCAEPNIFASGGGKSMFFTKPSWQTGALGIPADNARDVPDVSLTAASHDPYLICVRASCVPNAQGLITFVGVSGTSAATPAFAGIMALAAQKTFVRLGQPNYVLYRLAAAENLSQCDASNTSSPPTNTCIFNDVTVGNNTVPGETSYGTPTSPYQSGVGYDLATGLGSVNVTNLIQQWKSVTFNATGTTFSINPVTAMHGSPLTVSGTVTPNGGEGTPTGVVWITQTGFPHGNFTGDSTAAIFHLDSSGSYNGATNLLPGGSYQVNAHYAGDGTYGGSDSPTPVQVTITPETTTTTFSVLAKDATGNLAPFTSVPYGTPIYFQAQVNWQSGSGSPTGNINYYFGSSSWGATLDSGSAGHSLSNPDTIAPVGSYSATAIYLGDNSFSSSAENTPVTFSITGISTQTTLTSQQNSQRLTLTAAVTGSGTGSPPTGLITFSNGAGGPALGTAALSNGTSSGGTVQATATLDGTKLAPGQYNFIATYPGNGNYGSSTSATVPMTLTADFTISNQGIASQTVSPGQTASYVNDIVITPLFGYSATVSVSCVSSAPKTTCSANPSTFSTSTGVGFGTVAVTTTANAGSMVREPEGPTPFYIQPKAIAVVAMVLCLLLVLLAGVRRRRLAVLMLLLFILTIDIAAVGCGGGGAQSPSPPPPQGTPPGSYTVTVTGTVNSVVHTTTLTLIVQ